MKKAGRLKTMNTFLAAVSSAFDLKKALLAGHAQHPVIIHFPIALFIASVALDLLALWRKRTVLATVAYYNLIGAAITLPLALATGLGAWHWQLEGAPVKGTLLLHMIFALTSASLIFLLCWMRPRLSVDGTRLGFIYFSMTLLAMMAITITGHLGGILSGVEG
jgi:uncharacterized membrane protein